MAGAGRALWGSPSPTPFQSRVTQSRLHKTASRRGWNISREGDSTASLGSLGQGSITLRGKKFFLMLSSLCSLLLSAHFTTIGLFYIQEFAGQWVFLVVFLKFFLRNHFNCVLFILLTFILKTFIG